MTDTYITLVASDTSDPKNTSSRFTTRLPETLHLSKDRHKIGLVDIIFPATIQNFASGGQLTIKYTDRVKNPTNPKKTKSNDFIRVPGGHYESAQQLEQILNSNKEVQPYVRFYFSKDNQHFKIEFDIGNVKEIYMQPDLAYFLGFEKNVFRQPTEAEHRVDYFNQTSVMYVYCDVIEPSIMGSKKHQLLQCCPVTGSFGQMIRQTFNPIRYVPILFDTLDSIRIEILSEQGRPIHFSYGSVVLLLHIIQV